MIRTLLILALSALLCPLGACAAVRAREHGAAPLPEAVYRRITASQAKAMMDGGVPYVLLDVRTEAEFKEAHIDGAVLIPYDRIVQRAQAALPDKDALILVYCRSGGRSAQAAKALVDMGYTKVYDFGGILDWPHEVVTAQD